jgi:hypothetical protein
MFDIVFFDYWKRGTRHFAEINSSLRSLGMKSVLIHIGSQRGEPYSGDEVIDGILCRDIAYYDNDLIKMLKHINPKVVVLLNNQTQDKIITRVSRGLGIKTVFLMHGVLALNKNLDAAIKTIDSAFGFGERVLRIVKYFKLLIMYFRALAYNMEGGLIRSLYEVSKYFLVQFYSPASNLFGKYYYHDSMTTRCLVYSERDKHNFVNLFKFPSERVLVVGNYNLDKFIIRSKCHKNNPNSNYLLYIENGFSDPKFTVNGWSEELVKQEVENLAAIALKSDLDIYVKLHPSSDYDLLIQESFFPKNVKVFKDNLDELVINARGVIGQSSSVIVMAVALNKPICILNIEPLPLAIWDYVDDGVGTLVNNIQEFEKWVKTSKIELLDTLHDGKSNYFYGPFDGKSNDRIVDNIIKLSQE